MSTNFPMMQRICLFVIGLLVATPLSAQTKLAYKHRAGDVQKFVMKQVVATEMTVPGQPNPVESKTTQTMYLKITTDEVSADGIAKQRQEFTRIVMVMTLPGPLNFEYDSSSAEQPKGQLAESIIRSLKPLVNAEFKQTIDAQGKILELLVPETVAESLKSSPGAAMLGEMSTPEGLKKFYKQASVALPANPVKVGSTWEQSSDNAFPFGTMTTRRVYKYLGPEKDSNFEKVGVDVKVSIARKEGAPAEIKLESNKGTGHILLDNRTGKIHENSVTQTMAMQVTAGGQTINQKVFTEVTMRSDKGDEK